jgi:DNA-binding transcriptional MerR regulator
MMKTDDRKKGMRIGDLARRAGLSSRAVRYYEELGLISPSSHSQGGFRLFGEEHLRRLELINSLKEMGLSLTEIGEIMLAGRSGGCDRETLGRLLAALTRQLYGIDLKMESLRRMKDDLGETLGMLRSCLACDHEVLLDAPCCEGCRVLAGDEGLPEAFRALLRNASSDRSPIAAK